MRYIKRSIINQLSSKPVSFISLRHILFTAANPRLIGGGAVDGAIAKKGGKILFQLRKNINKIPLNQIKHMNCYFNDIRCLHGDVKVTKSGYPNNELKCNYIYIINMFLFNFCK